ncbi:MAG: hypothetical protein LBS03_06885 [Bacteroidales bacterium]|jgi:chemotaxis protein methyltransferase CheR|nr:hypothetical protein [Bacteroidales bacterium]
MDISDSEFDKIIAVIREHSAYDFGDYSDKSLRRRFSKVLMDYRIPASILIRQLETQPQFLETVVKKITVNTTEMFRDPAVWIDMRQNILPALAEKDAIHIWHAGCSSGQEVYSMMIMLSEAGLLEKTHLWATDLNNDVLETAREGIYKYRFNLSYLDNFEKIIQSADNPAFSGEELWNKYFEIDTAGDRIKVRPILLGKAVFAKHDLATEPNFSSTPFDLIICRNVIIYFNYHRQNKIFDLFYRHLIDNGILLLGIHESIHGVFLSKFEKQGCFYQKRSDAGGKGRLPLPSLSGGGK